MMAHLRRRMAYQRAIPREYSSPPCPTRWSLLACVHQCLELWRSSRPDEIEREKNARKKVVRWLPCILGVVSNLPDDRSWAWRRSSREHSESCCRAIAGSWSCIHWSFRRDSLLSTTRWRRSNDFQPSRSWHGRCSSVPCSIQHRCPSRTSVRVPWWWWSSRRFVDRSIRWRAIVLFWNGIWICGRHSVDDGGDSFFFSERIRRKELGFKHMCEMRWSAKRAWYAAMLRKSCWSNVGEHSGKKIIYISSHKIWGIWLPCYINNM